LGIEASAEQLVADYRGVKLNVIMSSLETVFSINFPDNFEVEYRKKVAQLFDLHLTPNQGVIELIESLKIPYCIASSAPRMKIEQALQVTGLDKYFEGKIFSAYEVGSWKPDPGLFLHVAETMQVEPANCYVIEDSLVGLQAANAAQMKSVYYAPNEVEQSPLAVLQVQHMSQLIGKL
jgi:HAD superfamily hydrolase (TIGR01509 family)